MKVIGITGGFGAGKTTVAGFFRQCGAVVLDADKIAHKAIMPSGGAYRQVVKTFGKGILKKNSQINRKCLAEITFKNTPLLKRLCRIIHPIVIKDMKKRIKAIAKKSAGAIVVLDAPLLIEAGLINMVDKVIVVKANRQVQIRRCRDKTGLSKGQVLSRIKAQMPINQKIGFSDFVIDNSGNKIDTKRKVKRIWGQIQQQTMRQKTI